jgi:hypothetical protein
VDYGGERAAEPGRGHYERVASRDQGEELCKRQASYEGQSFELF